MGGDLNVGLFECGLGAPRECPPCHGMDYCLDATWKLVSLFYYYGCSKVGRLSSGVAVGGWEDLNVGLYLRRPVGRRRPVQFVVN